ncbi:hypothetical protein [uncultured Friedmanniella sp.]|uniref:hypothetical protein n=1 Tax=uncultured Friedmanniella sp. TaxID=335381 RepID=UPI0035CBF0C9
MSSYRRPIHVWRTRLRMLPGPPIGWICRHCPANTDAAFVGGYEWTLAEACDAGIAHTKVCPWVTAGLDRLVAAVMAVPDVVRVPELPGAYCRSCDQLVEDEQQHVEHHIVAAQVDERARLQAIAWADLGTRARDLVRAH